MAIELTPVNPLPYRPYWSFADGAVTNSVWATFQVPADISSATLTVYIWTERPTVSTNTAAQTRWGFDAQVASRGALGAANAVGNQTGAATLTHAIKSDEYTSTVYEFTWTIYTGWRYAQRDSLGTITVSAGDNVHIEIYRDPTHADDTYGAAMALFLVEFEYTADS